MLLIAIGSKLQSLSSGELWSHVLTVRNLTAGGKLHGDQLQLWENFMNIIIKKAQVVCTYP